MKFLNSIIAFACMSNVLLIGIECYNKASFESLIKEKLDYDNTTKIIKELLENGNHGNQTTDTESLARIEDLNNLLWVRELNDVKCSEASWNKYLDQLLKFEEHKLSLIPYLLRAKVDLNEYCKNKTVNYYATDLTEMRELDEQIFKSQGVQLEPKKALDLLRRLERLLKGMTNKTYVWKLEKIKKLIEISELTSRKCIEESWEELRSLRVLCETNIHSIIPYLLHWRDKRRLFCQERQNIREKIGDISNTTKIYEIIFSQNSTSLSNETIRELLVLLRGLFNFRTNIPVTMRINVIKLSEFGENPSSVSCSRESWDDFLSLLEENRSAEKNIIPFLVYSKERIADICSIKCGSSNYFTSDPFDWESRNRLIFANDSAQLEPIETLKLMKELQTLYRNRTDSGSVFRRDAIRQLLSACQLSSDNCEERAELKFLFNKYENYTRNVMPYLQICKEELDDFCNPHSKTNFKDTVVEVMKSANVTFFDRIDGGNESISTMELMRHVETLNKEKIFLQETVQFNHKVNATSDKIVEETTQVRRKVSLIVMNFLYSAMEVKRTLNL